MKRRRYTKLRIDETSGVDRPAQAPALAVALFKRADGKPKGAAKGYMPEHSAMTTAMDGHQHLLDLAVQSGQTSWSSDYSEHRGHSHPYVVGEGGAVTIGEAANHTHQVAVASAKGNSQNPKHGSQMSSPSKDNVDLEKRIDTLVADLATAKALASMTDAQKAHLDTLTGDAAATFLAATPEKRGELVEAAKAEDPIVYTSKRTGDVFRKSDDSRLVAMAKRDDERELEATALRKENRDRELKARVAKEFAHLPGGEDAQVALLEAVESIEDADARKAALAILRAQSAGSSKGFERAGVGGEAPNAGLGGNGRSDAERKINERAKAYATEKGLTFTKAYAEFTRTAEGEALLAEALGVETGA